MYFEDLTPYRYLGDVDLDVLNVGWLDVEHAFPTGEVDDGLLDDLRYLAVTSERNVTRGWHYCDLCPQDDFIVEPYAPAPIGRLYLGHSEILVQTPVGRAYAAPTLVIHYVAAHRYQPPTAFIDAVRAAGRR